MYTEIIKIAKHGLEGNKEQVKSYMEHFVKKYRKRVKSDDDSLEQIVAQGFKKILKKEVREEATLDSN